MLSYEEIWHYAAGIAGNLFALGLFLSPIPTFSRITRNRSTEQFSVFPYIFALFNCLICTWYGLPFVSQNNILVTTVNAAGAIFQLFYISLYIAYCQKEARVKMIALLLLVVGIVTAIALVTYEFMEQPLRKLFVGSLSVFSLISMFASPLSIIVRASWFKTIITLIVSEAGNWNKKRGVYAILSLSFHPFDECILFRIWIPWPRSFCLCPKWDWQCFGHDTVGVVLQLSRHWSEKAGSTTIAELNCLRFFPTKLAGSVSSLSVCCSSVRFFT